jgi:hypothetical protein
MSTKMKQVAGSLQSLSAQLTTATTDMHLMTTGQHALSANMGSLATALAQQLVVQNQMLTRLLALEGQFVALQTEVKDRSLKIEVMAQTLIEQKLHGHNLEASNRAAAPNAAAAPAATAGAPTAVHTPTDAAPAGGCQELRLLLWQQLQRLEIQLLPRQEQPRRQHMRQLRCMELSPSCRYPCNPLRNRWTPSNSSCTFPPAPQLARLRR